MADKMTTITELEAIYGTLVEAATINEVHWTTERHNRERPSRAARTMW